MSKTVDQVCEKSMSKLIRELQKNKCAKLYRHYPFETNPSKSVMGHQHCPFSGKHPEEPRQVP